MQPSSTGSLRVGPGAKRSWARLQFYDYPRTDGSERYGASSAGKTKVYCIRCLDAGLSEIKDREHAEVASGIRQDMRSDDALKMYLWTSEQNKANIRSSHVTGLLNHLVECQFQPEDVKQRAAEEKSRKAVGIRSLRKNVAWYPPIEGSIPATIENTAPTAGPSAALLPSSSQLADPQFRYHPYLNATHLRAYSPVPESIGPGSPMESIYPSDSISVVMSQSSRPPNSRTSSVGPPRSWRGSVQPLIPAAEFPPWTPDRKKIFERHVLRLTASAGFALSWIENPEWGKLCDEFMPGAPHISRKVLTQRILQEVAKEFRAEAKKQCLGKDSTMQSYGWTGVNNHHLVAVMLTADKRVHTVQVNDTTKKRKTAETLHEDLEAAYKKVCDDWGSKVAALVTDAAGDARKARRLFCRNHPSVIVLDCCAHQINLVVGDFFKSKSALLPYTEMATQLITWLRSKTLVLSHLPLAVLRAVLTRWTAHYSAYRRLLQLYTKLISLALADLTVANERERIMITGDAASQRKAQEMVGIIQNPLFWHSIALVTRYLEPLAIAANITQQSFCRLDQVLLTFGYLVMKYNDEKMKQEMVACQAIISSIELRWAKSDQEVFIAAVLVNPFYRMSAFRPLQCFNKAEVRLLFSRLYRRFYGEEPIHSFIEDVYDFLDGKGMFHSILSEIEFEIDSALRKKDQPDPLNLLEKFIPAGRAQHASQFILFARRLLSISANSASCERLFSVFGTILTKIRNRTQNTVLTDLAEIKMHIRDEHLAAGNAKSRLKRHIGHGERPSQINSASVDVPCTSAGTSESGANIEAIMDTIRINAGPLVSIEASNSVSSPSPTATAGAFSSLVLQHISETENDNEDNESANAPTLSSWRRLPLSELFDFASKTWLSRYSRFAQMTFEQELEIYDLLDLDADGEMDPDIDTVTQDILLA